MGASIRIGFGIAVAALVAAGVPAFAGTSAQPSATCRDGANTIQVTVPGFAFGVELGPEGPGETGATVCYSDTANGTPSDATGGFAHVRQDQDGETFTWCGPDAPADVVVGCQGAGHVGPTSANDAEATFTTTGAVTVFSSTTTVGTTGAVIENVHTDTGTTPEVAVSGVCVWVLGAALPAGCADTTLLRAKVESGDVGTGTTPVCIVRIGGSCTHAPGPFVETGADPTPTVDGNVGPVPVTQDTSDICVGICP